ncbi:hypothetical protein E2562_021952 [Oryza meyeriana var. granulata]|uniref:Ubiquitin-like domain-containing protein n=1 Tax=Oryza meyeriana var. granulata TaxID=110450 RepID=A0A6G1DM70_9ORYZ|nr:hypothetical protein E2562_021952 [Oryza meyeriana var. granulata]
MATREDTGEPRQEQCRLCGAVAAAGCPGLSDGNSQPAKPWWWAKTEPTQRQSPDSSLIVNVKHFIMSSVGLETPRANDFQIRFKAITLFDDSTLAQNGVNEHDTLFCLPSELEQQGEPIVIPQLFEQQGVPTVIPSLPQQTPQETLVDHLLDEDADTYMDNNDEFYLSDFTDAPNDDGLVLSLRLRRPLKSTTHPSFPFLLCLLCFYFSKFAYGGDREVQGSSENVG